MHERNVRIRITINAAIAGMTAVAWVQMALGWGSDGGLLLSVGIESLKYFTVLSNIFSGIVSFVVAARLARGREVTPVLLAVKLAATTSVALTFTVVVAFLAPLFGWIAMFVGANFWLHLALPLAAIIEFCLFETGELPRGAALMATIPTVLYGAGYYINILINGVGEWPNTNDWYGFLAGGIETGPIVFAVIASATWLLACLIVKLRKRFLR